MLSAAATAGGSGSCIVDSGASGAAAMFMSDTPASLTAALAIGCDDTAASVRTASPLLTPARGGSTAALASAASPAPDPLVVDRLPSATDCLRPGLDLVGLLAATESPVVEGGGRILTAAGWLATPCRSRARWTFRALRRSSVPPATRPLLPKDASRSSALTASDVVWYTFSAGTQYICTHCEAAPPVFLLTRIQVQVFPSKEFPPPAPDFEASTTRRIALFRRLSLAFDPGECGRCWFIRVACVYQSVHSSGASGFSKVT